MLLKEQKTAASDDMKSEIQRLLVEAEGEIRQRKECVTEQQRSVNSHKERLGLLVKEGEYESTTNIINTVCTVCAIETVTLSFRSV